MLAKEKGIQNDRMVKVFNEKGEVVIRAKILRCSPAIDVYLSKPSNN